MARIRTICKPSDYPGTPDKAMARDLAEFFAYMFPGEEQPEFKGSHLGWAILAAQSPKFALIVAQLTKYVALEMEWCKRDDLRELAVQTLNLHFKCDFSFQSHLEHAGAAGVGAELIAAIPYWRTSTIFTPEQRLVIAYTFAVVSGDVPDELFARVVARFGEKQAIEFTTVVGLWSFWAMILNATRPEFPFAAAQS